MRVITYLLIAIIVVIGLAFASLNAQSVTVNFAIKSFAVPLSIVLVLTLGIGLLLGLFVAFLLYIKLKRQNMRFRSRIKMAEKEINNLRNIPIKAQYTDMTQCDKKSLRA